MKNRTISTCPTNKDVLKRIVADIRTIIWLYEIDGLVLDFIYFESPIVGFKNFLNCFCENCIGEMRRRGYDPYKIKVIY